MLGDNLSFHYIQEDYWRAAENKFLLPTNILRNDLRMRLSIVPSLINLEGRELLCSLLQANIDEKSYGNVGESIIGSDGYSFKP